MTPAALIEALCRLGRDEFEEVLAGVGSDVTRHVPEVAASRVQRAEALVQLAPDPVRTLVIRLDRARPADPLRAWRYAMLTRARELPVVGFRHESRYRLALEDVYEPLALGRPSARAMDRAVSVEEAVRRANRLADRGTTRGIAVVGAPGAGKTTTLQWLHAVAEYAPGSLGLPADTLPVLVPLASLSVRALRQDGLGGVVAAHARAQSGAWAEVERRQLPLLLLLDGLDEVLDDDEREEVANWLVEEMVGHDRWRYVVSCRVDPWDRARSLESRLVRHDANPLTWEQVERFVHRWYRGVCLADRSVEAGELDSVRAEAEREGDESAAAFLPVLRAREREEDLTWRGLSRNPLLLSTICLVHAKEGELPRSRAKLYEECLGILLRARTRRTSNLGFRDADAAIAVLRPLATRLQDGDVGKTLPDAEAETLVSPRLAASVRLPEKDPAAFLRRVVDTGVLIRPDRGRLGFYHQTAQEYLSARERPEVLVARLGHDRWREPLRLAASMDTEGDLVAALLDADLATHEEQVRETLREGAWRDPATFAAALRPERPDAELAALLRVATALGVPLDPGPLRARLRLVTRDVRRRVDPKTGMELVWVPAEPFIFGTERPEHPNDLPRRELVEPTGFWIGRFPVTNTQYRRFVNETGAREPRFWGDPRFNRLEQPVVAVTWEQARAYCAWAMAFLPSEEEWEHAARGPEGRRYPWGDTPEPDPSRAAFGGRWDAGPPEVGGHPTGASPCGAEEMAGLVWEWTMTTWQDDDNSRVPRGGSWVDDPARLRCVARRWPHSRDRLWDTGFRVGFRPAP